MCAYACIYVCIYPYGGPPASPAPPSASAPIRTCFRMSLFFHFFLLLGSYKDDQTETQWREHGGGRALFSVSAKTTSVLLRHQHPPLRLHTFELTSTLGRE